MYAITSDSIKIIGIIGILQIKKFELSVKPNEHAKAMLSCLVDQDFITEYSKSLTEKSLIGILNRQEISIFSGYLSNMSIKKNGQVYEADFSLVSCSSLLDVEKKQRSFQKISDTYDMLLQQVAKDANDMWINCYEGYHTPIGNPIFQYEETNWEFLKRIASHLGTVIIPQVSYGVPQISFGVRKIDSGIALTLVQYKKGISKKYYELGGNRSGYAKAFFEYWEVTCYQNLNIGDVVNLNGRDLMVVEKQGTLVNAELLFTYRLGYDTLFLQPKILNEKACGAALRGTVTDVIADKIKIQLHIDDIKDKNELFFFDWVPITGNLMFCMPEIGTEVDLILNDCSSSNPVALSCFRNNGSTCNNTKNPLQKIFEFPTRKSLRLNDKEIIAESNDISTTKNIIEIKDGESITLDTQYPFDIATLFKLLMEAGLISIKAPVQIEVKEIDDTGATISINETIDINGKTYTIRAEERIAFSIIDDAPKKIKLNWWKLAFKIALTVLFVAVVATVAVALAPVTLAASTVVGAVVMAALVGGVVSSLVTVSKQYISDAKQGINRSFSDYLYLGLDSFCTGAITSAPMALPCGLGNKVLSVGMGSAFTQGIDALLDESFGGDFYDVDKTFDEGCVQVGTDMLSAFLGETIVGGMNAGKGKLYSFSSMSRQQYRAMAKKIYGSVDTWRLIAAKYASAKAISKNLLKNNLFKFLTAKYSMDFISGLITSSIFTDVDVEDYGEPYTVIEFDENGDFKFEKYQFE